LKLELIRSSDHFVGNTLKGRFRVVSLKSQDEHCKVYIARDLSTDLYELRVYPFGEVGNRKKKQLWRDCQKQGKRRNFVEAWKHDGYTFMLFHTKHTKRVSFQGTTYIIWSDMTAFGVQDSIADGDNTLKYHQHDAPPDINDLEEFPGLLCLPRGKELGW
jgi:hypothetical protein